MKIRQGFVSNSSSSSFIVRLPDNDIPSSLIYYKEDEVATESDLKKILEFGFRPTTYTSPSALEHSNYVWKRKWPKSTKVTKRTRYLGYCVICNENEVIRFLVQNNIPFRGATHYGHYSVFFRRGKKTLLWLDNLGVEVEMYGHSTEALLDFRLEHNNKYKPIRVESIKYYMPQKKGNKHEN